MLMNGFVYVIMLFMFVVVVIASYIITKILLNTFFKWLIRKQKSKKLEAVYRETMKY